MSINEIEKLIDILPRILCYIYPGYITLYFYYYFTAITLSGTKEVIVKSIVVSYLNILLTKTWVNFLNKLPCVDIVNEIDNLFFNLSLIITSILIAYLVYLMYFLLSKKSFISKILKFLKIGTSLSRNEIDVLQKQYNDTIWIYVYIKNSNLMYEGSLTEKELENGKTKFFCLSCYRKYIWKENGRKKLADYVKDKNEKVLIYVDMISHFEIANINKEETIEV